MTTKLRNDALLVQPCPIHGRKPELRGNQSLPAWYQLVCPVAGCICEGDAAPTVTLAMEEWDSMAFGLSGRDGTPEYPLLALESGDDDQPDPFDPENEDD